MRKYEYRVVPAPLKGLKSKGVRGTKDRFANALQTVMNEQGQDGWQYLRTDTLPCEERQGLARRSTVFQNMLVFCREIAGDQADDISEDATRSQKAIDHHPETVMPEPTDLWAEVETEAEGDAPVVEAEVVESAADATATGRLGGVTRKSGKSD